MKLSRRNTFKSVLGAVGAVVVGKTGGAPSVGPPPDTLTDIEREIIAEIQRLDANTVTPAEIRAAFGLDVPPSGYQVVPGMGGVSHAPPGSPPLKRYPPTDLHVRYATLGDELTVRQEITFTPLGPGPFTPLVPDDWNRTCLACASPWLHPVSFVTEDVQRWTCLLCDAVFYSPVTPDHLADTIITTGSAHGFTARTMTTSPIDLAAFLDPPPDDIDPRLVVNQEIYAVFECEYGARWTAAHFVRSTNAASPMTPDPVTFEPIGTDGVVVQFPPFSPWVRARTKST